MKCQDCNEREAQVHLTQIVNNVKTSLNLCKQCAAARGFHSPLDNIPFPLADLLPGMGEAFSEEGGEDSGEKLVCSNCGLTFQQFTRQGRFGCGTCYTAFRDRLEKLMRQIHGASLHRGRSPIVANSDEGDEDHMPVKEEARLQTELQKAIDSEDFERAAEIRDKLRSVRELNA